MALTHRGRASLNRSIQWGDAVLSVDVEVESRVGLTLVPITYRYSVIQNDRVDLGVFARPRSRRGLSVRESRG